MNADLASGASFWRLLFVLAPISAMALGFLWGCHYRMTTHVGREMLSFRTWVAVILFLLAVVPLAVYPSIEGASLKDYRNELGALSKRLSDIESRKAIPSKETEPAQLPAPSPPTAVPNETMLQSAEDRLVQAAEWVRSRKSRVDWSASVTTQSEEMLAAACALASAFQSIGATANCRVLRREDPALGLMERSPALVNLNARGDRPAEALEVAAFLVTGGISTLVSRDDEDAGKRVARNKQK